MFALDSRAQLLAALMDPLRAGALALAGNKPAEGSPDSLGHTFVTF